MARFRFDPDSFRRAQARIDGVMAKKQRQLTFALANWAWDVVGAIGKQLVDIHAVDQGILAAATTATPVEMVGTMLRVVIYNPVEYAVIVEFGRQPGKYPPLLPIAAWTARKGITTNLPVNMSFEMFPKEWAASGAIIRNMGSGGGKSGEKTEMDPIVHDLLIVRLIARKIAERGIAGRHPFSIVWEQKIRTFKQDIVKLVS